MLAEDLAEDMESQVLVRPSQGWGHLTRRCACLGWTLRWRQVGWPERSLQGSPGLRASLWRHCPSLAHPVVVSSYLPTRKAWQACLLLITSKAFRGRPRAFLLRVGTERGQSECAVSGTRTVRAVPDASPFQRVSQAFKTPASFRSCAGHGLIGTNGKRT